MIFLNSHLSLFSDEKYKTRYHPVINHNVLRIDACCIPQTSYCLALPPHKDADHEEFGKEL